VAPEAASDLVHLGEGAQAKLRSLVPAGT